MHMSNNVVVMSKPELRAMLSFTSSDPANPYITGIRLDFRHCAAVATDGHTLVKCQPIREGRDDAGHAEITLSATASKTLLGMCGRDQMIAIEMSLGKLAAYLVTTDDGAFGLRLESALRLEIPALAAAEQSFPPYSAVIPARCPEESDAPPETRTVGLNPVFLARVAAVAKLCSDRNVDALARMQIGSNLDPIRFDIERPGHAEWTIVIMPCRI